MTVSARDRIAHLFYLLTTFPETWLYLFGSLAFFCGIIALGVYMWGIAGPLAGEIVILHGLLPLLYLAGSLGKPYVPNVSPDMPWWLVEANLSEIGRVHPMLAEIADELKVSNRRRTMRLV